LRTHHPVRHRYGRTLFFNRDRLPLRRHPIHHPVRHRYGRTLFLIAIGCRYGVTQFTVPSAAATAARCF
jgi:hypothetical protein